MPSRQFCRDAVAHQLLAGEWFSLVELAQLVEQQREVVHSLERIGVLRAELLASTLHLPQARQGQTMHVTTVRAAFHPEELGHTHAETAARAVEHSAANTPARSTVARRIRGRYAPAAAQRRDRAALRWRAPLH